MLRTHPPGEELKIDAAAAAAVKRTVAIFDKTHGMPLFATRKLAFSTSLPITL